MSNGIKVVKRDGRSEGINLEKVHKMVDLACEGLAGEIYHLMNLL